MSRQILEGRGDLLDGEAAGRPVPLVDPEAEPEQAERRHRGVELPELPRRDALVIDGPNGVDDAALRLGDAPQMLAREVPLLLEIDREEFGPLGDEYPTALGVTLIGLGVQTIFGSFFLSLMTMRSDRENAAAREPILVEDRAAEPV